MRNLLLTMLITAVTLLAGCKSEVPAGLFPDSITFNLEDVELIELTNPRHIELDPPAQPNSIEIYDTLLIVSGKSTVNDYALHIHSAATGKLLNSMVGMGRGPGEVFGIGDFQILPERRELSFFDGNSASSRTYSLDSILYGPLMPFKQVNFSNRDGYQSVVKVDDDSYFVNSSLGVVKEGKPLQLMAKYSEKDRRLVASAPFPPHPGVDSTIANERRYIGRIFHVYHENGISHNPKTGNIVISYLQTDLIEIYDTDLNRKLRIHGPDQIMPVFEFADLRLEPLPGASAGGGGFATPGDRRSPVPHDRSDVIVLPQERNRIAYGTVRAFDDGFYAFYSGNPPSSQSGFRYLIFFRYDGTPLVRYSFDIENRGSIAIDHQRGVFYLLGQDREIYVYKTTPLASR